MLRLAKENVPGARFIHGDILDVDLEESSFDAVVAIFVLFHLPCEEHESALRRVWSWLRPGGRFLVTLTEDAAAPYIRHDFFGTDMYWSHLGFAESKDLLAEIGFETIQDRIVGHGYGRTFVERDERHPMVLMRKPSNRP